MKYLLLVCLLCLPVTSFAAASPPTYEELAKLPVVRFGDPVPDSDYILQFPAGKPVTISVSIEGSLFAKGAVAELAVTPSREIFVFREWEALTG